MPLTILEMAANVRQKKADMDAVCQELRRVGGEWTDHSIAAEDAMKIAEDGLRNCWAMLDRLHAMARAEVTRMKPNDGAAQEG